jgi:hypothetical protein
MFNYLIHLKKFMKNYSLENKDAGQPSSLNNVAEAVSDHA